MRFTHATNEAEKVLQAKQAIQSLVSILIFRAIFGVTDTNFSNVLVADDKLYSVDENSVGKFKLEEVLKHKPVQRMFKKALVSSKTFGLKNLLIFLPSWVNSEGDKNEIERDIISLLKRYELSNTCAVENFNNCCTVLKSVWNVRSGTTRIKWGEGLFSLSVGNHCHKKAH